MRPVVGSVPLSRRVPLLPSASPPHRSGLMRRRRCRTRPSGLVRAEEAREARLGPPRGHLAVPPRCTRAASLRATVYGVPYCLDKKSAFLRWNLCPVFESFLESTQERKLVGPVGAVGNAADVFQGAVERSEGVFRRSGSVHRPLVVVFKWPQLLCAVCARAARGEADCAQERAVIGS